MTPAQSRAASKQPQGDSAPTRLPPCRARGMSTTGEEEDTGQGTALLPAVSTRCREGGQSSPHGHPCEIKGEDWPRV